MDELNKTTAKIAGLRQAIEAVKRIKDGYFPASSRHLPYVRGGRDALFEVDRVLRKEIQFLKEPANVES